MNGVMNAIWWTGFLIWLFGLAITAFDWDFESGFLLQLIGLALQFGSLLVSYL